MLNDTLFDAEYDVTDSVLLYTDNEGKKENIQILYNNNNNNSNNKNS